jgi:flagellar hook-associated protein 1 FlgK
MSLFGTIQMSAGALNAASLGMQVTGNNIANANTPGYVRERLLQSAIPGYREGALILGLGVRVDGVQQVVDKFLEERLRNATSDVASSDVQADAYAKLEAAINELGDADLSTSFTTFFGSLQDVLNQPESISVRSVAVQKAQALAQAIQQLDSKVRSIHQSVNQQVIGLADDVNGLLAEVAKLNVQIVELEGGAVSNSDAVGLRDRQAAALARLSEIADIRVVEQPTGDVMVYSGGEFLVARGTYRQINVVTEAVDGLQVSRLEIEGSNGPLVSGSGRLGGLIAARDEILTGFLSGLDEVTSTLIFEFNKVHSGGQGLSGFSQLTSENGVSDVAAALDAAGLDFTPMNGAFQVLVYNTQTGQRTTTDIQVDLNGLAADTSLTDLAAQLDAVAGIGATINSDGELQITTDSAQTRFAFAADTSGVLAALGLNTFFSGTSARNIGISQIVKGDPGKLAMASGGIGEDTQNGELLANFLTTSLSSAGGASLATMYDRLTIDVAQGSQSASAAADGFRNFQQALESQHLAISGVNIDEEAVRMIEYQRAFQASAKVIATVNDMLQTLLDL